MALPKLFRYTLERYLTPAVCKVEPTPATLQKCLNKRPKWIERAGRDNGNYPIYVTTLAGRKILDDDKKARG